MEKKQDSFVKGAAILGIAGLLVKIIGACFRIPLANAVGTVGMSYYEVAYPYYSALLVISSAGLPTAISKMVSECVILGDLRGAKQVFKKAQFLLFIIGLITCAFMFFGADLLASISTFNKASLSFKALAPALLIVSLMCSYRGYLQGLQMMTGTAVSQVVEQVGKLAISLTLAKMLLPRGPEYAAMGALIGVSISELLALITIIIFYLVKRKSLALSFRKDVSIRKNDNIVRTLLAIAIPITIGASIGPLTGIVDSALIGRILRDIGFNEQTAQKAYSILRANVSTLINMPGVFTMSLAMSLVPAISASMTMKNYKSVRRSAKMGLKLALLIGLPCAAGLFILGKPILSMLYSKLTQAELALGADLMRTASIGVIFLSLVQAMTGVIQGIGKPNVPVFNLFIGFILKAVTMLVLMRNPKINIQGAAISTVVCYAYAGIMDMLYIIKKTNMQLNIWDMFGKPVIATLLMAASVYFVKELFAGKGAIGTLIAVAAGILVFFIAAFVFKILSKQECEMLPGGRRLSRILFKESPSK